MQIAQKSLLKKRKRLINNLRQDSGESSHSLFVEVVLDGGDDADGFHEARVGGGFCSAKLAKFAGVAALVGGENREDALIGLANAANLGARIGGETIGGSAGVTGGFG